MKEARILYVLGCFAALYLMLLPYLYDWLVSIL